VAHSYNLSYSGGRDKEDHGSKPALGKYLVRPYLEKTITETRTLRNYLTSKNEF
jgi:hypothetical protein